MTSAQRATNATETTTTTAKPQVYIAIDDANMKDLVLSGGDWWTAPKEVYTPWFGPTGCKWPNFAINGSNPAAGMSFGFSGTAFALYGNTAPTLSNQKFSVSIDGSAAYSSSSEDTSPQNWIQWYQSPALREGAHVVQITDLRGHAVDLLLVTPSPNTPLAGQTLLVDDSYVGIRYNGSGWTESVSRTYQAMSTFKAWPLHNGTHQTSSAGDSMSFSYTGTSMQIYGILPAVGSVSLSYTVDNSPSFSSTHVHPGGQFTDLFNRVLVDTGPLTAGNHTVVVTLTGAVGQPLIVDYITYVPSFNTLSAMPVLDTTTTTSVPSPISSSDTSSGVRVAAIVGGVSAVVIALFLTLGLVLWMKRRRRREQHVTVIEPMGFDDPPVTPFQIDFQPVMVQRPLSMHKPALPGFPAIPTHTNYDAEYLYGYPPTPALAHASTPFPPTPTTMISFASSGSAQHVGPFRSDLAMAGGSGYAMPSKAGQDVAPPAYDA